MTTKSPPSHNESITPLAASYHKSDAPYDTDIAKKALKRLQKQVIGNGINPKHVKLKSCDGENAQFYGMLRLKLNSTVTRQDVAGETHQGERISAGSLNVKIDQLFQEIIYEDQHAVNIKKDIESLPNKGFGLNNKELPLPVERHFIEEEQCQQCRGQGSTSCSRCNGQTRMNCQACSGSRFTPCMMCRGTGRSQTAGSQQELCTYCQGRGQMNCTQCRGAGQVACTQCGASGKSRCKPCGTTGKISHISSVKISLTPHFETMKRGFPKHINALSAYTSEELCTENIISVAHIEDKDIDQHIHEGVIAGREKNDYIYLPYVATCPSAKLKFSLAGKKTLNAEIIGFTPLFQSCENIMDLLFKKPYRLLTDGANTSALSASKVKEASKWRSVKNILALSVQHNPAKILPHVKKQNPIGLSEKMARALCIKASHCIKNITRMPRYIALVGVSVLSVLLYKIWIDHGKISTLNQLETLNIDHIYKELITDTALISLMIGISIILIKIAGFMSVKSLFKTLGINSSKPTWPRAGKPALYSFFTQPLIFILVALFFATEKTEWLSFINF